MSTQGPSVTIDATGERLGIFAAARTLVARHGRDAPNQSVTAVRSAWTALWAEVDELLAVVIGDDDSDGPSCERCGEEPAATCECDEAPADRHAAMAAAVGARFSGSRPLAPRPATLPGSTTHPARSGAAERRLTRFGERLRRVCDEAGLPWPDSQTEEGDALWFVWDSPMPFTIAVPPSSNPAALTANLLRRSWDAKAARLAEEARLAPGARLNQKTDSTMPRTPLRLAGLAIALALALTGHAGARPPGELQAHPASSPPTPKLVVPLPPGAELVLPNQCPDVMPYARVTALEKDGQRLGRPYTHPIIGYKLWNAPHGGYALWDQLSMHNRTRRTIYMVAWC